MIAALVPVSQYIGSRGSTQHNTFLLLIHVVFEASIFVIQFSIASEVLVIAAPEFGEDVRADCMRRQPIEEFQDECDAYRRSDRYHGFRLVWASNYERAQTEPDSFSKVDKFQNDGDCCGVAPPLSCIEDARKWPSDRPLTFVQPEFRSQRQICGSEPSWFPSSGSGGYSCSQVVDPTAATQVTGGCRYEMPLGAWYVCVIIKTLSIHHSFLHSFLSSSILRPSSSAKTKTPHTHLGLLGARAFSKLQ